MYEKVRFGEKKKKERAQRKGGRSSGNYRLAELRKSEAGKRGRKRDAEQRRTERRRPLAKKCGEEP